MIVKQILATAFIIVAFMPTADSQDTLQQFINNNCQYKIDGSGDAAGMKMQINIPCAWDSLNEGRPHLIRSFRYQVKEDNYIGMGLMILKVPHVFTKKEIDTTAWVYFFQQPSWGKLISNRSVILDGIKCTEAHTYITTPLPQGDSYQHVLSYLMVYKDCLIVLTYKSMTFDETSSKSLFEEYERLFKALAAGTILYNHWESPFSQLKQDEISRQSFTCDSNLLNRRAPFKFKSQREKEVAIWVMYYIDCGRLKSLIESAGKIGQQTPIKLSNEERPDLDTLINNIKSFISSLSTHGDIKELRGLEKAMYCYSIYMLHQFEDIRRIIQENSCSNALKKIGEFIKNNSKEDEKIYSLVLEKTNSIKRKYNLDKWQPSKKESDDFVEGKK
jgi:hypothetical protein